MCSMCLWQKHTVLLLKCPCSLKSVLLNSCYIFLSLWHTQTHAHTHTPNAYFCSLDAQKGWFHTITHIYTKYMICFLAMVVYFSMLLFLFFAFVVFRFVCRIYSSFVFKLTLLVTISTNVQIKWSIFPFRRKSCFFFFAHKQYKNVSRIKFFFSLRLLNDYGEHKTEKPRKKQRLFHTQHYKMCNQRKWNARRYFSMNSALKQPPKYIVISQSQQFCFLIHFIQLQNSNSHTHISPFFSQRDCIANNEWKLHDNEHDWW